MSPSGRPGGVLTLAASKVLTFRLPCTLNEKLQALAKKRGEPVSKILRRLIEHLVRDAG